MKKVILATILATIGVSSFANVDEVKKNFEKKLGVPAESVSVTPIPNIYEVVAGGDIVYTTESVDYLLAGKLLDTATKKSLTDEKLMKLNAIDVSKLPLKQAIKIVKGKGQRVIYTFEDPNCGYCKKLAKDSIAKMDNVTVYTFAVGVLGPESISKAKKIMCSSNPTKSWNEWMTEGKLPEGKEDCSDASIVDKNQELAQKYKVRGTPTFVFADGSRAPGAIPLEQIEARISIAATAVKK